MGKAVYTVNENFRVSCMYKNNKESVHFLKFHKHKKLCHVLIKYQLRDFMFKQFMKDPSSYMKYVESVMFDHYTEVVKDYDKYDVAARLKIDYGYLSSVYED